MTIKRKSVLEKIIKKTGKKPSSCSCEECRHQCTIAPCLGTPEDMKKLYDAGYGDRLADSKWAAGILLGVTDRMIDIIAPLYDNSKGSCTFFKDGLCELHDLGLKPTEGRLSHHTTTKANFVPSKSIAWNVAKTWI